jgi:hypothetical protein
MEDVLEVYHRPRGPDHPGVCVDDTAKQLIAETRVPVAATPGRPEGDDYEHARNGTTNLCMRLAPPQGWRHAELTGRHAAMDYAQVLTDWSDTHYPNATKIGLVQDNLSRHKPAPSTRLFPPRKHPAWPSASSGTTRPDTAVGLTWLSVSSVCCRPSVSTAGSPASTL